MKTLILVRHAKAGDRHKHLSDLERALTPSGEKDAKRAAKLLKSRGITPALMISSPANRALETAHIVAKELEYPIRRIMLKQAAYDARDTEALFNTVREIEDRYDTVILFGHNPSLEDFAASLLQDTSGTLQTAGIVQMEITKESWRDLLPGDGQRKDADTESKPETTEPSHKEIRRGLRIKIDVGLRQILEGIHTGAAIELEKEIAKTSESLAKRLAKLIQTEQDC